MHLKLLLINLAIISSWLRTQICISFVLSTGQLSQNTVHGSAGSSEIA